MHCPGAIGNPFIHLSLGQAQFELKTVLKPPVEGRRKPQPPVAAPRNVEFADGDGNGCDRAVVIRGSRGSRDIVASEMAWLGARHPGYKFSDNTVETRGKRTFEEITIETAAGERKVVCFEVTEGFGHLGR